MAALAQPVCTLGPGQQNVGQIPCYAQAVNPQLTDIVLGTQQNGPNTINQTVKFSLQQLQAVIGVPPGADLSTGTAIATGSITARTLADRFADTENVRDFGSAINGSTNDSAAFNTARAAITTGDGRLFIPSGTLSIPTPPAIPSGTFAIWDMQAHPAAGFNAYSEAFTTDVVHTTNQGEWWYQRQTSATANQGTGPMLRADRKTTHTGGTGWAEVQINDTWDVGANPGGQMTSLNVVTTKNNTAGPQPAVGIYQTATRTVNATGAMFGANFKLEDQTGVPHTYAHITGEWDILGNGTWANNQAGVLDMVLKKSQSGGTTFQANFGLRVGNWTADLTQGGFQTAFLAGVTNVYTSAFGGNPTLATGAIMFDASSATYTDTPGVAMRVGSGNAIDFSNGAGGGVTARWDSATSRWRLAIGGVDVLSVDGSGTGRAKGPVTPSVTP